MRYCRRCLEPDTRPGAVLDEAGICLPCRYSESLPKVDWVERRKILDDIIAWARSRPMGDYDCIIPVSGGKDSTRQALFARDALGLKPLLVTCSYPPHQQTDRGAHNMANLIQLGFDAQIVSPAPETWRNLMRLGFYEFGNMYKSTELALYASVPRFAIMHNIPLIFYGENPALAWGGTVTSEGWDANHQRHGNTVTGGDLTPYLSAGYDLSQLYWYRFPSEEDVRRTELRMIFLGYFMPDFNDEENARVSIESGLRIREGEDAILEDIGQVTLYDALDDDFVMVNQMLKYFKFGFGKATQQLSGFVRTGKMTREEAVHLARLVDGQCADRYVRRFCDFIGIDEEQFWARANALRDPGIWEPHGNGWRMREPLR